jgi:hypothetical protein
MRVHSLHRYLGLVSLKRRQLWRNPVVSPSNSTEHLRQSDFASNSDTIALNDFIGNSRTSMKDSPYGV